MSKGILYKYIYYPYPIGVNEEKAYKFFKEGFHYTATVYRHLKALEILDFDNEIVERRTDEGKFLHGFKNEELKSDKLRYVIKHKELVFGVEAASLNPNYFRTREFSEIVLAIEVEDINDTSLLDKEYTKLLSYFINFYRIVCNDYYVKLPDDLGVDTMIVKEAVVSYDEDDLNLSVFERLKKGRNISIKIKSISLPRILDTKTLLEHNLEENTLKLIEGTKDKNEIKDIDEFFIKAKEEFFINKNYKYAILELFTMIEVILVRVLEDIKRSKGVANRKIKDFRKEIPISYQLNVELVMLIEDITEEDRTTLGKIDKLRRLRNAIIHENKRVVRENSIFAFEAVENFLKLINEKVVK